MVEDGYEFPEDFNAIIRHVANSDDLDKHWYSLHPDAGYEVLIAKPGTLKKMKEEYHV